MGCSSIQIFVCFCYVLDIAGNMSLHICLSMINETNRWWYRIHALACITFYSIFRVMNIGSPKQSDPAKMTQRSVILLPQIMWMALLEQATQVPG